MTKRFSAGGDVNEFGQDMPGKGTGYLLRGPKYLIQNVLNCEVPIVAAINGYAIGLGATLALLADIIYMGRHRHHRRHPRQRRADRR